MSWNYRVIKRELNDGSYDYQIYAVYYDQNKKPNGISANPVEPYGETPEELKEAYNLMVKAFDKPVLDYKDFVVN